jgi:hypothetical protein
MRGRISSLGLEPAAARYAWWRGVLTGILAGAIFALTLAAVLPRSSALPQTSRAPVKPVKPIKSVTSEIASSASLEGIAKQEVLVLPPAFSPTEPLASGPIAPSVVEQSSSAVEPSSVDHWDFQNCVGCSVPTDAGAGQDASRSSDAQAQAPNVSPPDEIVQPPVVIVEPPLVAYFEIGAPAAFPLHPASPANAPPPGGLGMINPGFLGTIHAPAFGGGMPVHR